MTIPNYILDFCLTDVMTWKLMHFISRAETNTKETRVSERDIKLLQVCILCSNAHTHIVLIDMIFDVRNTPTLLRQQ